MKTKFFLTALILGFALSGANSQTLFQGEIIDQVVPGSYNKGYPGTEHNGTAIPIRLQLGPIIQEARALKTGQKFPLFLVHPGCGEKTSEQSDRTNLNASELWKLRRTAPFSQLQDANGLLWNRTYRLPDGTYTPVIWAGAQLWGPVGAVNCSGGTGGYSLTWNYLSYYSIKWLKEQYADIIDTNRIVMIGLSQGGGACNLAAQDSIINAQLSAMLIACAGYMNYTGFTPTGRTNTTDNQNWDDLARSGLPIWYFHSQNDGTTTGCGGGSGCSRNAVIQINSRNPMVVPKFSEIAGNYITSHWFPYEWAFNPVNWPNTYTMSTGETINFSTSIDPITWALQHTKNSRVSRNPNGK